MLNTYNHIRFRILVQCKGSEINITPFFTKDQPACFTY